MLVRAAVVAAVPVLTVPVVTPAVTVPAVAGVHLQVPVPRAAFAALSERLGSLRLPLENRKQPQVAAGSARLGERGRHRSARVVGDDRGEVAERALPASSHFTIIEAAVADLTCVTGVVVPGVVVVVVVMRGHMTRLPRSSASLFRRGSSRSIVELTPAGREHLESTLRERRDAIAAGLEGFSAAETATLANLLERFADGMRNPPTP